VTVLNNACVDTVEGALELLLLLKLDKDLIVMIVGQSISELLVRACH
jgi:hypothetical protein